MVGEAGYCAARDLSRALGVSEMTVHRDIRRLADAGLLRAVRGGASTVSMMGGTAFRVRAGQQSAEKRAIARAAVAMIDAGSIVGLDAGTTTLEIARLLDPGVRLSVVTYSLPVVTLLSGRHHIELISLGGVLHAESESLSGSLTLAAVASLRLDTLFLAASAIRDGAMYSGNVYDSETKRALISIADHVVLVADASKFSRSAMMRVASLDVVETAIVDERVAEGDHALLERMGIRVVVAHPDETVDETVGEGAGSTAS